MEEVLIQVPFTVIVDTREQVPFSFRDLPAYKRELPSNKRKEGGTLLVETKRSVLQTGDYSVLGMERLVAVERKNKSDFLNCMGGDRKRFEKQLERLNAMERAVVMVEAGWSSVLKGDRYSKGLDPSSIEASIIAWQQDYFPNIHWWFACGRKEAERATFRILERFWRKNQVTDLDDI